MRHPAEIEQGHLARSRWRCRGRLPSASMAFEEVDDDSERLALNVVDPRYAVVGLGIDVAVDVVGPGAPLGVGALLGEELVGESEDALELVLVATEHEHGDVDA